MRAGLLRHTVTVEAPTETQNEYGEPATTWTTVATVYARREDLTGREYFAAQQVNSETTTRFTLRYIAGITTKHRLLCDSVQYDIAAVQDPDGRQRELVIMAVHRG
jgi:SPP1 family predicted phage head-tail adaptor